MNPGPDLNSLHLARKYCELPDAWIIAGVKDWIGSTRRKSNDETEKDSLRSSHHTASMRTFVNGPKTRASAKPVPNHPPIGGNPERVSGSPWGIRKLG